MSNIEKFEELLRSDEGVQAKLRAAVEAYAGDKADEAAFFDATIGKVAAELDLPFSFEEGKAFALEGVELNDGELEAVAGGCEGGPLKSEGCYLLGVTDGIDADNCFGSDYEKGGGACAYVGITALVIY